jgi:hypothetical protein
VTLRKDKIIPNVAHSRLRVEQTATMDETSLNEKEMRRGSTSSQTLSSHSKPLHRTSSTQEVITSHEGTTSENNPNATSPNPQTPTLSCLRSTVSHQSRAGGDGYTCFDEEQRTSTTPTAYEPYLVKWEGGDTDSSNPRSMTKKRKWDVVCIVSASSLYV